MTVNSDLPREATTGTTASFLKDFSPTFKPFLDEGAVEQGEQKSAPSQIRRSKGGAEFSENLATHSALPDSLVDKVRWRTVIAGGWAERRAIHTQEALSALTGLRRSSRRPWARDCELLSFGGNMADNLNFERGRARDYALNALCHR